MRRASGAWPIPWADELVGGRAADVPALELDPPGPGVQQPGDRLELPSEVSAVNVESARQPDAPLGTRWAYPHPQPGMDLSRCQLLGTEAYAKFFTGPLRQGNAAIANERTGDRIQFSWETASNPHVGIWITRGGWHGYHHVAIEPTNAPTDSLATTAGNPTATTVLRPHEKRRWQILLTLSQSADARKSG